MKFVKFSWLLSRKTLLAGFILDYLIFFLLIFIFSTTNNEYINNQILIMFSFIWGSISYVFGRYFFKKNIPLYSSLKIYLLNTSKVFLIILFFYLLTKTFLSLNIPSIFYPILSVNFVCLFFILTFIGHTLLIYYFHKKSATFKKWIMIGNKADFLNKKIDFKNYIHDIEKIENFSNIFDLNFDSKQYIGVILSQENIQVDLSFFRKKNLHVYTLKDWCQQYLQRFPPDILNSSDIFRMEKALNDRTFEMRLKRLADILLSAILLATLSPVLIFFGVLIYLEDQGPILYSQIRTGHNLRTFRIYKLRSMKVNSEKYGAKWASNNDVRINKVGKIIRSLRIDELPQLWTVLKGEMSLIGPRPERPEFDVILEKKISFYNSRYSVKPGLSGWAQVNYPYGASDNDSKNKLSFDLYYIENFTFLLDLLIFFKTIKLVVNAKGSEVDSELI